MRVLVLRHVLYRMKIANQIIACFSRVNVGDLLNVRLTVVKIFNKAAVLCVNAFWEKINELFNC